MYSKSSELLFFMMALFWWKPHFGCRSTSSLQPCTVHHVGWLRAGLMTQAQMRWQGSKLSIPKGNSGEHMAAAKIRNFTLRLIGFHWKDIRRSYKADERFCFYSSACAMKSFRGTLDNDQTRFCNFMSTVNKEDESHGIMACCRKDLCWIWTKLAVLDTSECELQLLELRQLCRLP